jgi:replicative DNA helicase
LFVSSDEGELFQLLAGRYSGAPNFEIVLKAHTGGKLRVDRRGRSEIVDSATLVIAMTVQPDVLRGIAENPAFRARGLTARFLYTLPKSLVGLS